MAWLRKIRGMPAVSVAEGKEVGKVDAVLVDVDAGAARWLRLGKVGFFGGTRVISVDAIQAIGENAITVDSETSAVPIDDVAEAQELSQDKRRIVDNRMLTNKGRLLGEIRDYELDDETYEIVRYEIGKADLLGAQAQRVPADYVLTIGPDAVLVDAAIEDEISLEVPEEPEEPEETWEPEEPAEEGAWEPEEQEAPEEAWGPEVEEEASSSDLDAEDKGAWPGQNP